MIDRPATVSTKNTGINGADDPVEIELEITITVPESLSEAAEFFDGEAKLLEVVQSEVQRRKINAARAALREATDPNLDFDAFATQIAESYTPGRRGGFQRPSISADELAEAGGDFDSLMALLQARGVTVAS